MSIRNKGKGLFPTWTLRSLSTLWDTPGRGGRKGGVGNTVPRLQASTLWLHYVKSSFYILSPQRPACTTLRNLMRALCFLLFILNVLTLSLIYFKLSFVCGVRYESKILFFSMEMQLFQHHLLKRLFSLNWGGILIPFLRFLFYSTLSWPILTKKSHFINYCHFLVNLEVM